MSRRKPNITRKRAGESDEDIGSAMEEDYRDIGSDCDLPEPRSNDSSKEEKKSTANDEQKHDDSQDVEIPEGTVVVHPESVDDKRQQEVEMSASKQSLGLLSSPIQCTACHGYIPVVRRDSVRSHPVLGVLVCRKCCITHTTMKIEAGEDGLDESCRWCAEGGDLICCDFCHHAFCKICIRRNMGRTALNDILMADDDVKWRCYVCDPAPLKKLIDTCAKVLAETATLPQSSPSVTSGVKKTPKTKKESSLTKSVRSPSEEQQEEEDEEEELEEERSAAGVKMPQFSATAHLVAAARELASMRGKVKGNGGAGKVKSIKSKAVSRMESIHQQDNIVYIRTPTGSIVGIPAKRLSEEIKRSETSGNGHAAAVATVTMIMLNIDEQNVWTVLEKLLAATQSMGMLLSSLKDDLRRTGNGWSETAATPANAEHLRKKKEVATKLWRAFVAYKKSFQDIEMFSRGSSSSTSVTGKTAGGSAVAKEPGANGSACVAPGSTHQSGAVSEGKEVKQAATLISKKREAEVDDLAGVKRVKLVEEVMPGSDKHETPSSEGTQAFEKLQFEPLFKIEGAK